MATPERASADRAVPADRAVADSAPADQPQAVPLPLGDPRLRVVSAETEWTLRKHNADRLSAYFRKRRFGHITVLIRAIAGRKGSCRIIDVGGREEYWTPVLGDLRLCNAHVTIVNLEKTQPEAGPLFDFVFADACDLSLYRDGQFDLVHSNSLIEHLGRWADMKRAALEIRRLAPEYYVQTPYFWFPYEPHFRVIGFQWLPEQMRAALLRRFRIGYFERAATVDKAMADIQSVYLLDKAQLRALFPDAQLSFERVAGLPKSLIATRHATPG